VVEACEARALLSQVAPEFVFDFAGHLSRASVAVVHTHGLSYGEVNFHALAIAGELTPGDKVVIGELKYPTGVLLGGAYVGSVPKGYEIGLELSPGQANPLRKIMSHIEATIVA
jgi:hypothetical protein